MRKLYLKLWAASLCAVFACSLPQSLARSHEVDVLAVKPYKALQSIAAPKLVLVNELSPAAVPTAPVAAQGYSGTGDYYLDKIVQFESSGNQYAVNTEGACGLFQSLPCSKMGCALSDSACQISWGRQYVASVYGTSAAAWAHELAFHWY